MPGKICAVAVCKSNSAIAKKNGQKMSFFRFPKNPKMEKEWIRRCNRPDVFNTMHKRVCSTHFTDDDFEDNIEAKLLNKLPVKLKEDAVPTQNLLPEEEEKTKREAEEEIKRRKQKELVDKLLKRSVQPKISLPTPRINNVTPEIRIKSLEKQCAKLSSENIKLMYDNKKLKDKLTSSESEVKKLKGTIENLHKLLKEEKLNYNQKVQKELGHIFTKNEIDVMLFKKTHTWWTDDEIYKAITLRYLSKAAYDYMKYELNYPLPGVSTLQRRSLNMDLGRGIIYHVLSLMGIVGRYMKNMERVTVLSFAEMNITSMYEYDYKHDEIVGPHKTVQIIMARGLFKEWTQLIYVGFDTKITDKLLMDIIVKLHEIKYEVIACVSDCSNTSMELWKILQITVAKTHFSHPVTKENIFMFANSLDLLKITRNVLLDTGFILGDGRVVNVEPINTVLENTILEYNNLSETFTYSAEHLFSQNTVAALTKYFFDGDKDQEELANNLCEFIKIVYSWYDMMTFDLYENLACDESAYGTCLAKQNMLLDQCIDTFLHLQCNGKAPKIFQKCFIVNCLSLKALYNNVQNMKPNVEYILTHRITMDCLEKLFFQLKTQGGLYEHLSRCNIVYKITAKLFGNSIETIEEQSDENGNSNNLSIAEDAYLTESIINRAIVVKNTYIRDDLEEMVLGEFTNEQDGLIYLAGYLARKLHEKYPELGSYMDITVNLTTDLIGADIFEVTDTCLMRVMDMDKCFNALHGDYFKFKQHIVKQTAVHISNSLCYIAKDIVELFCKYRIKMRLKVLNSKTTKKN